MGITLEKLLRAMVDHGGSDLHLAVGSHPAVRVDGHLHPLQDFPLLDQAAMEGILYPILDGEQQEKLLKARELDFSYSIPGLSRFRGNILWQRGTLGAVFRAIPARPITLEELGLPQVIRDLAQKPRGLVLVTGPTGSGKSTTLAAMIDYINANYDHHIVTIEDPIEFMHKNKRCIVRQRELGADTLSFAAALKHVLRQDPDVILVGEMRDLETIGLAVTAAETGHLVFGTLHTTSAASTVDRVIDVFPSAQQSQIRMQLSGTLEGVVSQCLVPRAEGRGRACAMEIMVGTSAVRNMIREGKTHQINNMIQSGGNVGMQTLNAALKNLVTKGVCTLEAALGKSSYPDELRAMMGRD
ncbi:MAG: type IV pilus twitching motility protein PilT [Armatimonadetes bacterium]|nr:type IV pilus twitching motility protein PilT [Armatimonadota bacterium]